MLGRDKFMWVGLGVCVVGVVAEMVLLRTINVLDRPGPQPRGAVVPRPTANRPALPASSPPSSRSLSTEAMTPQAVSPSMSPTMGSVIEELLPPLQLIGTSPAEDPNQSLAMLLNVQTNEQLSLRLGAYIGSLKLTTIERGWVLFLSPDGREIRLELEGATLLQVAHGQAVEDVTRVLDHLEGAIEPPTPEALAQASEAITVVSAQDRVINRQQVFEALQDNPFQLLSQSRFVPHLDGAASGLQVAWVADSPWMKKVGLEVGDVVTTINGKAVLDPRRLPEVAQDLFGASTVNVTILRDGHELTLHYQMESPPAQPLPLAGSP